MTCFRKSRMIRKENSRDSNSIVSLFFRKAGTIVEREPRFLQFGGIYSELEDVIVVQLEGSTEYDSGYTAYRFPPTTKGIKKAHTMLSHCV